MATKRLVPRLPAISEGQLTARQRELRDAIFAGPRGKTPLWGPFGVFMHAPDFGNPAQQLGAYCRFNTAVPPRLSEFAILATARHWRAQFEWHAHAPIAERAGVSAQTIRDLRAGRRPAKAPKDELAIYDFISELYRKRRVSNRNYARINSILGDAATVELVGILGYYAMISMILNVFNVPLPPDATPGFREPAL
jgi:4-carboxymuconolactone decarboxylase